MEILKKKKNSLKRNKICFKLFSSNRNEICGNRYQLQTKKITSLELTGGKKKRFRNKNRYLPVKSANFSFALGNVLEDAELLPGNPGSRFTVTEN